MNDIQHNNTVGRASILRSFYAECHVRFIDMLNVIVLSVVMLSVLGPLSGASHSPHRYG
jgi:hypothetical protein